MIDPNATSAGIEGGFAFLVSLFYTLWTGKDYQLDEAGSDREETFYNRRYILHDFVPLESIWNKLSASYPDRDFDLGEKMRTYQHILRNIPAEEIEDMIINFHYDEWFLKQGRMPPKNLGREIFERTFNAKTPGERLLFYEVLIDYYLEINGA